MRYAAYRAESISRSLSSLEQGESTGAIVAFSPGAAIPVVTADTLAELRLRALAFLGREPDESLFLTDGISRVYELLQNSKHQEALNRARTRTLHAMVLLIFCLACLVATAFGVRGDWALLDFVGATLLYFTLSRIGLGNEGESALFCGLLLIIILLLIPSIEARNARVERAHGRHTERPAQD